MPKGIYQHRSLSERMKKEELIKILKEFSDSDWIHSEVMIKEVADQILELFAQARQETLKECLEIINHSIDKSDAFSEINQLLKKNERKP